MIQDVRTILFNLKKVVIDILEAERGIFTVCS